MRLIRRSVKTVAAPLAAAMLLTSMPLTPVFAGLVPTESVVAQQTASEQRQKVSDFMAREDVRQQMAALGVDAAEAERRVASLTDAEIGEIAGRIDQMPAGGDGIGVIIGAAVLIFIILLITDIAGLTSVFPFTNKARR